MRVHLAVLAALFAPVACADRGDARTLNSAVAVHPDVAPVLIDDDPPFRYPAQLWAQRVQGNVVLRVFVNAAGRTVADSTRVEKTSGIPALDSAARAGAARLRFTPARVGASPVSVALLLPVFFRHPDAPPLPGDSVIARSTRALAPR